MNRRYRVEVEFSPGVWTPTIETDNADLAVGSANFWDERLNTRFIDYGSLSEIDRTMLKFDAAIDRLARL